MNILAISLKFTTYGTLNFFVSEPILKLLLSAESLHQRGQVTKYSPLPATVHRIYFVFKVYSLFSSAIHTI